jgi:class 3 adenylate cyclase
MDLFTVVDQVIELLRSRGRVSYRALRVQFNLDDEALEALKAELIGVHQIAVDQEGTMLVWTGDEGALPKPPPRIPETPLPQPRAEPRPADAECRQLTVLFCDLVDSTVLASQLDPEDWREVVRAYQETCATVIARYEGHIAQYLGDGLLVHFGYPRAHEDDPQRAVWAGLDMLEAMGTLNTGLARDKRRRLAVRIGIHTGLVVVGEMGGGGRQEHLALGNTPNVAARIQGLATPDTIVISAATYRLVQGYFTVATLGPQPLKGVSAPVPVYRILGASAAQSRLDVAEATGLTPLVGRESDVALLLERWEQSQAGLGQVVAQRFPLWLGHATCWRGWALGVQGQGETGLAPLHQGMAAVLATGQMLARPFCLVLLAEAAGHAGQIDEGLRLLAETQMAVEESGRGELLAEAYRLQGELLRQQAAADAAQAEACFEQALAIAGRQQAKSWELRAAMSLSRLWQQQGKHAEARALLAPIYGWFTEGFDTADLQEARVLLEELS